jgi:Ca2+-binding EF-hand superfamily protein
LIDDADEIFDSVDTDHNGRINYLEFTTAAIQKDIAIKQEYIKATFAMFD